MFMPVTRNCPGIPNGSVRPPKGFTLGNSSCRMRDASDLRGTAVFGETPAPGRSATRCTRCDGSKVI